MPRRRLLGKVEPTEKIWLSKQELASYLGVKERFIKDCINKNPKVKIFQLSPKCFLYDKENIDRLLSKFKVIVMVLEI